MLSVADVVGALERLWPPSTAESWDAVGPVCGDPAAAVSKVLFAIDPVAAVVDEALAWGADLLVTHHPLFLRGTPSVYGGSPKGRVVQRLVAAGCALHVAHTNADVAVGGVSDALADALGLLETTPLRPAESGLVDSLVVYVPSDDADRLVDALATAGAGTVGAYDRCAFWAEGTGTFRPLPGSTPAFGEVGRIEEVGERRVELVLPRARRAAVVEALRAVHPYEQPAFHVIETAPLPDGTGSGRVGRLVEPLPLRALAALVAGALPATPAGLRVGGDLNRTVRRVAVCGGAGDGYLPDAVRAGADAYVTADLRHHYSSEHLESGGPALVDPGHWASEWPWLPRAAAALDGMLAAGAATGTEPGATVETRVSTVVTDPWTLHVTRP